jgi:hypothetical protein
MREPLRIGAFAAVNYIDSIQTFLADGAGEFAGGSGVAELELHDRLAHHRHVFAPQALELGRCVVFGLNKVGHGGDDRAAAGERRQQGGRG